MIKNIERKLNPPFYIPDPHPLEYMASNGCMSLHQTNVRMSGNIKTVWKSDNEVFLESISSDDYFSSSAFKKFAVDMTQGYKHNLYNFLKEVSNRESIWKLKDIEAAKAEQFSDQYEYLYNWGAYTETNDLIGGRFRFFAPLFTYGKLPDRFIILRVKNIIGEVDGISLRDYVANSELVLSVDLKESSNFGSYLRTLTESPDFKQHTLFANFKESFIRYYGFDINSGKMKYVTESDYDSYLANERTITEYNNAITNGWMRSELLCPNILNLEFAFDDPTAPVGFNTYIGFYCYDNEVDKSLADIAINEAGVIVLNEAATKKQIYRKDTEPFPEFTSIITTTTTTQPDKYLLQPIAEITLPFMPIPSSSLSITYMGNTEVEVYMLGDILNSATTDEVLQKIANYINNTNTTNIVITASVVDHKLIIRSQVTDEEFENIVVKVPAVFNKLKPTYYSEDAKLNSEDEPKSDEELYDTMRMITYRDLFITSTEIPDGCDCIEIDGVDYVLEQTFKYLGGNVIRLNNDFSSVYSLKSNIIKFKKTNNSTFNILSYLKHVNFDMSMKDTPYYDIFDFDIKEYQLAYANSIYDILIKPVGKLNTEEKELIDAYRDYFNIPSNQPLMINGSPFINTEISSMYEKKNVLVKSIDNVSLQPEETINNEYERFSEDKLVQIRNANLLEPHIAKFVGIHGTDMYGNPISLNSALPWGSDNFLNTGNISVSPEKGSHQWFILGAGPAPYSGGNFKPFLNSIQKQLGYANIPDGGNYHSLTLNALVSDFDFTSVEHDAYDALEYKTFREQTESRTYFKKQAWANMFRVEGEVNRCNAIFRGTEWSFIGDYEGYRFAVVMVTCSNSDHNHTFSSPYNIVDNQVFKTLTLVIINYIPDNLLTTGGGTTPYYLDRSFFYYSDKAYGSSKPMSISDLSDTNTIKLNLFDNNQSIPQNTTIKYITPWLRIVNNKPQFRIGYIKDEETSLTLKDIVGNERDFEWLHVNTNAVQNDISILSRYTAHNIVELSDDELWCEDILIEFAPNPMYMSELNMFGYSTFTAATFAQIFNSDNGLLHIGNTTYRVPFWEKIKESKILEVKNPDNSARIGISLLSDFYYELSDTSDIPSNLIKTSDDKKFLVFNNEKNVDKLVGNLLQHDQYWVATRNIATSGEMLYLVNTGTKTISNQLFSAGYAKDVIDSYALTTYVVNRDEIIPTKKSILMLLPDETFIIVSIAEKDNELYRLSESYTFKISRHTGYYGPLFRSITVPESLVVLPNILCLRDSAEWYALPNYRKRPGQLIYFAVDSPKGVNTQGMYVIENDISSIKDVSVDYPVIQIFGDEFPTVTNRYVGQLFWFNKLGKLYQLRGGISISDLVELDNTDIELIDCVIPYRPIPGYIGRKICTSTDNIDNYCEEVLSEYTKNPTTSQSYYSALYEGIEFPVATEAALSEHKGLLSNTYNNSIEINCKVPFSETVDLISASRSTIAPVVLSRIYGKDYTVTNPQTCINALKLYNTEINSANVVYENVYERFYERFYLEWFSKHYRISKVTTEEGYSIGFSYTDISNISIDTSTVFSKRINSLTLTFQKI